jgi:hypothetical protein
MCSFWLNEPGLRIAGNTDKIGGSGRFNFDLANILFYSLQTLPKIGHIAEFR